MIHGHNRIQHCPRAALGVSPWPSFFFFWGGGGVGNRPPNFEKIVRLWWGITGSETLDRSSEKIRYHVFETKSVIRNVKITSHLPMTYSPLEYIHFRPF
jgi:hypothetical protein